MPYNTVVLAARGESRTEPFDPVSARMQGAAKRRIPEVFKRAATPQTGRIRPNGDAETFLANPQC